MKVTVLSRSDRETRPETYQRDDTEPPTGEETFQRGEAVNARGVLLKYKP